MEEGDMGIVSEINPEPAISKQLARIIEIFNEMNATGQDKLYEYAEDLIVNSRYKKDNSLAKKSAG